MADAKKCDRCGSFYMPKPGFYGRKNIRIPGNNNNHYDLCEKCQHDLDEFMDNSGNDTACENKELWEKIYEKPITIGYSVCRDCVDEVIDLLAQYKERVNDENHL